MLITMTVWVLLTIYTQHPGNIGYGNPAYLTQEACLRDARLPPPSDGEKRICMEVVVKKWID